MGLILAPPLAYLINFPNAALGRAFVQQFVTALRPWKPLLVRAPAMRVVSASV